ncbi:MAG: class I SAM-dependent methyltransferase [Actinobacteria bacterium]|nr:class I SAM-dependent methyltransferase [Actinomycetota bacterium]MBE3114652.1 class I SAM-dependent methyltransferase [Actinomycetota bacterium]
MIIKKLNMNKFKESYTPFQEFNKQYLKGDMYSSVFDAVLNYSDVGDFNDKYEFIQIGIPTERNISNPITLKLIESLIKIKNPKAFLEIGTFIGVSTVCFKNALSSSSNLTFIEVVKDSYDATLKNLKEHTSNTNILGINGDALDTLKVMNKNNIKYDFIYLDGGKENYCRYMKYIDKIIAKEGILIVDDVFFHGDALNDKPITEKGKGVKEFLRMIKKNKSYKKIILPISNGVMLLIKE